MIDKLEPIRKSEVRQPSVAAAGAGVASTKPRPKAPALELPDSIELTPIEMGTCDEVAKQQRKPIYQVCVQQQIQGRDKVQSQSHALLESDVEGRSNERNSSDDNNVFSADERCVTTSADLPEIDTNVSVSLEEIPAPHRAPQEASPNMSAERDDAITERKEQQVLQQTPLERNYSEEMVSGTESPKPQQLKQRSHHRAERRPNTQRWVIVLGSLVAFLAVVGAALSFSSNLFHEAHLDTHTTWVVDTYGAGKLEAGSVLRFCGFGTSTRGPIDVTAGGCEAMFLWVQTDGQVKVYRGDSPSTSGAVVWRHKKKYGRPLSGDNFVDYSFEKGTLEISREGTVLATFRAQQL